MSELCHFQELHAGRVAVLTLDAGRGNVLDQFLLESLTVQTERLREGPPRAAVILQSTGPHFSYGASVQEHRVDEIGPALERLDYWMRAWLQVPGPTIAVVQGLVLGGGLELVLACDLVLAAPDASFACPEISLGVFPPAAAALLPARVGGGMASFLTLTGESIDARRALEVGLVQRVAPGNDLGVELGAWLENSFLTRSAASLAVAATASRWPQHQALESVWPTLMRTYLDKVAALPDAIEGVEAFLAKRAPRWGHGRVLD